MKAFIVGILFLGCMSIAVAQSAQITGTVSDPTGEQALEFASLSLFSLPDSTLANGTLTDTTGRFQLEKIPAGRYYLKVRFLGYQEKTVSAISLVNRQSLDVGIIQLTPSQLLLDEVEISGRKATSYQKADRQVYAADQFRNAQGGSATDVLGNLPAISVNAAGEITVRGATGFVVMINGKQIQTDPAVILNQLPANAIENIEIITSPSAKFDPDGKAGIINIITRKGATDGFYLMGNLQGGLPPIERYGNAETSKRFGGDLTVNYKEGKWDLSAGVDYRRDDIGGRRIGYVNTYEDGILTEFPSYGERSFDRESYSGRFSAIFTPTEKQTIGASFLAGKRTQYRAADILYDNQQRSLVPPDELLNPEAYWDLYNQTGDVFGGGQPISSLTFFNENLRVRKGDFFIAALDYAFELTDKSSLKLAALYERTILGGPTDNVSLDWPNTADTLQQQFNDNDNPLDGLRLNADYSQKLGEITWESGYQFRYLRHPGDFEYLERDFKTDAWVPNPEFTNRIELRRAIHSLYSQMSGTWEGLEYNAGLRLEFTDREVDTAEPDTTYLLDLWSLFPSLNLRYKLGKDWFVKTGYSRRIGRTTTFKMTPFPEREHSETLEQGDAELLPELIDVVELGMQKNVGDNNFFITGYYRHVRDVINRVNTIYNDTILNRIYTNAGNAQAWGVEGGATVYPVKGWSLYAGANVYSYRIKGDLFGDAINTANTIYSINANTTVQLIPTMSMQAGFSYLSRRITAQGVDSRFYNPNLTLRKTFWDKKIAATLQWRYIDMGLLNSNEQRITTVRDDFYTTTNYVYEVDVLMIGISYQLNQPSKKMKFIKSEFGDKEF